MAVDAVALLGGNEYLVQQLLDRLLDAGFSTAQVIMVVMVMVFMVMVFMVFMVMVFMLMVLMVIMVMALVKASILFNSCWIGFLIWGLQQHR